MSPKSEDFTQVARRVVDEATRVKDKKRDPDAVERGRKGGLAKARKAKDESK
jgi:hypothetical protein